MYITYADLLIPVNDQAYIDSLIDERNVDCSQLDISYVFEWKFSTANLTNAIISEIFGYVIMRDVKKIDDQDKLLDSIYTNCTNSQLDIWEDEVETEEAKYLIRNLK